MRLPLLLAAAVLLLAGCSSPDKTDGDGAPAQATEPPTPAPTAFVGTPAPAPQHVPIQADGTLGACVGAHGAPNDAGVLACKLQTEGRVVRFQQAGSTLLGLNATVQWSPASPTMDRLRVRFAPVTDCGVVPGDLCFEEMPLEATGASPLVLAVDGLGWTHGDYAIVLDWAGDAEASPEQPFTVFADVLVLP